MFVSLLVQLVHLFAHAPIHCPHGYHPLLIQPGHWTCAPFPVR